MTNKFKHVLATGLVATTTLATIGAVPVSAAEVSTPETQTFSQVIAFGDSHSDNGNGAFATSSAIVSDETLKDSPEAAGAFIKPGDLYWENRYSDGQTAVEILAEKMGVELTNYATGGGTSGHANYSDWMDLLGGTGALGQIDKFETSLNEEAADEDALYFIFTGANDYYKALDYSLPVSVEFVAYTVVDNIVTAVESLSELGAENFFISNSSALQTTPYEIGEGRAETAEKFTNIVNAILPNVFETLEETLDINIIGYDYAGMTHEIIANPDVYGITIFDQPVQPTWPEVLPARPNPETYLYFDEYHYSAATHKIIGEDMYNTLVEATTPIPMTPIQPIED